ncbi:MAG: Rieske (2Fe-2S) protein [Deltaproteobacteria bacterium]|nr:Rieske (2Fe-2S) protein [Deltaproteobacteria bacterium]
MERRGFLKRGLLWLMYVSGAAVLAYPAFSFMGFRKITKKRIVFQPDELSGPVCFKEGVYLIGKGADVKALSARCTHLGCIVNYDAVSRNFKCPCHGSIFGPSGRWISGPAGKDLISIPAKTGPGGVVEVELEI